MNSRDGSIGPFSLDKHPTSERLIIAVGSFAFLGIGFLLDVATAQELVVAILYNVPIAFSGLSSSRRLSYSVMAAALVANLVAGYFNALALGGVDAVAILNRLLAGLSFLLVGFMTRALRRSAARLAELQQSELQAEREHKLHKLTTELSGTLRPQAFLQRTCEVLKDLLEADAVVISGASHNRFVAPQYVAPQYGSPPSAALAHARAGEQLPWLLTVAPTYSPAVAAGYVDAHPLTVGYLHRGESPDLALLVVHARSEDAVPFLGDALRELEPLLERAALLENLDQQKTELERRNGVIRDLVYAFSHDLRTPLIANAMNMRLALDGAFGPLSTEFERTLENGLSANEDLLELADSLLFVARRESGEALGNPEPVSLPALLQQAAARLEPVLEERQIKVQLDTPEELKVLGRPSELRRVFQNLLDNAAKFSPQDSVVEVNLVADNDATSAQGARLEVLDRGKGISSTLASKLFGRFSHDRAGGGTGLGLYLARQIVNEHGGEIRYSPREGGGSLFTVWLPVAKEAITA